MKLKIFIFIWLVLNSLFLFNLISNVSSTENETLIWESYLLYIMLIMTLGFPFGSIFSCLFILIINFFELILGIDIFNDYIFISGLTISSFLGAYIQWFKIYPKMKEYIKRWLKK